MGTQTFNIFKVPDSEIVSALQNIAKDCGLNLTNATINLQFGSDHHYPLSLHPENINDDLTYQKICNANAALTQIISIVVPQVGVTITISRNPNYDLANVSFRNEMTPDAITNLLIAVQKYLKSFAPTTKLDQLLGEELSEFYRRREEGLLRLEGLSQRLIEQNEQYKHTLDEKYSTEERKLNEQIDTRRKKLHLEIESKEEEFLQKQTKFAEREKELDDRSSKHARRQIRQDLKESLGLLNKDFSLTKGTSKKRLPIHALFIALISLFTALFIVVIWNQTQAENSPHFWYLLLRIPFSAAALGAAIVFYIKWNDQWASQHADEEFRLKRLELDIDRASWVVEMALEWLDEKGSGIPESLIDRLSRNLFSDRSASEGIRHPAEDLASNLLNASSSLNVKIPGLGEANIDRKGLQQFKKNTDA